MRTWCEFRNFASQKFRLTPGVKTSITGDVTVISVHTAYSTKCSNRHMGEGSDGHDGPTLFCQVGPWLSVGQEHHGAPLRDSLTFVLAEKTDAVATCSRFESGWFCEGPVKDIKIKCRCASIIFVFALVKITKAGKSQAWVSKMKQYKEHHTFTW